MFLPLYLCDLLPLSYFYIRIKHAIYKECTLVHVQQWLSKHYKTDRHHLTSAMAVFHLHFLSPQRFFLKALVSVWLVIRAHRAAG